MAYIPASVQTDLENGIIYSKASHEREGIVFFNAKICYCQCKNLTKCHLVHFYDLTGQLGGIEAEMKSHLHKRKLVLIIRS